MTNNPSKKFSLLSRKVMFGTTLGAALFFMVVGVIFWGGFNTAMEVTNTTEFCITCHEMEANVYQEYVHTNHYSNRSGVRASCSDCHVPDPWIHKVARKIEASRELYHKAMGTISTPEKFDNHRLRMATKVWGDMKSTDSRECRNCHDFDAMDPEKQQKRSRKPHAQAMIDGNTCIDCHQGIAHTKVHDQLTDEELEQLSLPIPENIRPIAPQWQEFIDNGMKLTSEIKAKAEKAALAKAKAEQAALAKAEAASAPPVTAAATDKPVTATVSSEGFGVDWSGIEAASTILFFPGQASMEWTLKGSDHGGKRAFQHGDRCYDCHVDEEESIGELIVSGEKVEPTPIPGKRGSIPVAIKAAHDTEYLYMQFQWPGKDHSPAPFVEGGKMDPENPMKFALMLAYDDEENPKVEYAERAGCWQSCHHDNNYMPHQPDKSELTGALAERLNLEKGFTKYLKESRTSIEIDGKGGKKRGGWPNLREETEIQALKEKGTFMDLLSYKSGTGESKDGHILAERVMTGGQGVEFSSEFKDGNWILEMKRKLTSDQPGDVSMALDQWYNIGFAIHDDYSYSRFHHVSLGFKLGFDDEYAEINAIAR